jgi:hypothetical protein
MPPTPGDAPLIEPPEDRIPALAELYDKFAHSLEPFSVERDNAEHVFVLEVLTWWQALENPKPAFREFRRGVIAKCRRYLAASDKPQDKQLFRKWDENQSSS